MERTRVYVSYNRQYQSEKIRGYVEELNSTYPDFEFVYSADPYAKNYTVNLLESCQGVVFIYPSTLMLKNTAVEVQYTVGRGQAFEIKWAKDKLKRSMHIYLDKNLSNTAFTGSLHVKNEADYRNYATISLEKIYEESLATSLQTLKFLCDKEKAATHSKNTMSKRREDLSPSLKEKPELRTWQEVIKEENSDLDKHLVEVPVNTGKVTASWIKNDDETVAKVRKRFLEQDKLDKIAHRRKILLLIK